MCGEARERERRAVDPRHEQAAEKDAVELGVGAAWSTSELVTVMRIEA